MDDERTRLTRWRLVLGGGVDDVLGALCDDVCQQRDAALSFLYDREYGPGRNVRSGGGQGSLDPS